MQVTCIIGLETNELFREALKSYLDDSNENLLHKCLLQNSDLQSLQFDTRQKYKSAASLKRDSNTGVFL